MATTKVINDLIDLNQSGSTSGLKGCAGTTAQRPTESFDIEYLIVGGGGTASGSGSGGGGAGGLITGTTTVASGVSETLQIGAGAVANASPTSTSQPNGGNTVFSSFTADGGGSGQSRSDGTDGGSGGGGGVFAATSAFAGGSGTISQGNDGGDSNTSFRWATGGGGGSGNVGNSSSANQSGNGGSGTNMTSFISVSDATSAIVGEIVGGTNVFFAGGGGGGGGDDTANAIGTGGNVIGGTGGSGGGGTGSQAAGVRGTNGTINSGGGGGGGVVGSSDSAGGDGGSGVAIFKYDNTKVTGVTVDGTLVAPSTATVTTSNCNYPVAGTLLYQFENNLNDTCGSYNATVGSGSATYIAGKYGNAVNLNGSSYLTLSSTLPWSSSFTISLWINPTTLPSGNFHLPFMQSGYSSSDGVSFYLFGSAIRPYISVSGTAYELFNTGSLSTGVWQNIVLVRTYNTSWELYLNGSSLGTYTAQGLTTDFSTSTLQYFGANSSGLYYYNGGIDQVRIFPSALSQSEITELNNEVAYKTKFTNGTTDTIVFKEGSGNITFQKADAEPGAEIGMLRCNTTLGQMEHYTSSGYKTFTNL